jgi:flavin-dependent dehydrogenase
MRTETPDLLVVGGGPAGLVTAIRARQEGLTATVLERGHPGRDKACGEGLMPDAVARLASLGVDTEGLGMPFPGIRYLDGETGAVAEGCFPPGVHGLGVRRSRLHRALVERAREVGADLRWGVRVDGLRPGWRQGPPVEVDTAAGPFGGHWLVAADGLHSPLRRQARLASPRHSATPGDLRPGGRARFGVRRHYRRAPWAEHVEVYWASRCEAYVTPVAPDEVGVALLWSGGTATFDDLLSAFPTLARRLQGAATTSRDRGCGPLRQRARAVHEGRLALVGDAAGYLDAITGEGLALAFHQAFAVVDAVGSGSLARYDNACRRIARIPEGLTRVVLWVERHPAMRRRLIGALAADPGLFDRLLAIHAGCAPLSSLGLTGVGRLLRGLVLARVIAGGDHGTSRHETDP